MKLSPQDAAGFLARPAPQIPALLIYGADAMRVAEKRVQMVRAHAGPQADGEMRLARLSGADLRKDGAALIDAAKAQGFFPGPRAVIVDDATDGTVEAFKLLLSDWARGDALIVATAGLLTPASKLRKLFEGDKRAFVLPVYDNPPSRDEVERMLQAAGLITLPSDTLRDLMALAQALEPGDFRQTLERIALYKHGDPSPLSPAEIALLAPGAADSDIDDALNAVADGRMADLAPILSRLGAQGVTPVSICISLTRHFRVLHTLLSDPRGASQAIGTLRPPVFGPRRDTLLRQAQRWSLAGVEDALRDLTQTDLTLRSSTPAPVQPLAERALLRISRLAGRR